MLKKTQLVCCSAIRNTIFLGHSLLNYTLKLQPIAAFFQFFAEVINSYSVKAPINRLFIRYELSNDLVVFRLCLQTRVCC